MQKKQLTTKENNVFITFEGIDACGKSTQAKLLSEFLEHKGYDVLLTKEPGGTDVGRKIMQIVLDSNNVNIDINTEILLYAADRIQHIKELLIPALQQGKVVISDRYIDSSYAYQGVIAGKKPVYEANNEAANLLTPDLTILIITPVEECLGRLVDRKKLDRIESRGISYQKAVEAAFLGGITGHHKVIYTSGKSISEVHELIKKIVLEKMK